MSLLLAVSRTIKNGAANILFSQRLKTKLQANGIILDFKASFIVILSKNLYS